MLNSVIPLSLEDACMEAELNLHLEVTARVRSKVLTMILNPIPQYLHSCSLCVVWEVGHMIAINRYEEAASNVFNTQSITWHTLMPCTP